MHQQNMWKGWQPINDHWYLILQATTSWEWVGGLQIQNKSLPTALVVCGVDGRHTCLCVTSQTLCNLSHASTRYVEWMITHPWPFVPHFTTNSALLMAWWSAYPVRPGPTSWEVCGLDGGYHCVCIVFQACPTILMHQQDMWNGWQPIYCHWYIVSQPTPPWE